MSFIYINSQERSLLTAKLRTFKPFDRVALFRDKESGEVVDAKVTKVPLVELRRHNIVTYTAAEVERFIQRSWQSDQVNSLSIAV